MHRALRNRAYEVVRRLLFTQATVMRRGRSVGSDTIGFAAYSSWQGDTLVFVPYPRRDILSPGFASPDNADVAVRRQRQQFHDIAVAWVAAFPQSADALHALAISLDLLGDRSALDTLRRARDLAATPEERLRTAGAEIWLRVKNAIPADSGSLNAARAIADSVLREFPPSQAPDPLLLASLAGLTGRGRLAVEYVRHPAFLAAWEVPPSLSPAGPTLLVLAALGAPADSLRALERTVNSQIGLLPAPQRQLQQLRWLARAATLAMPTYQFSSLRELVGIGDYLVDAQAAFALGDTDAVHRVFDDLRQARPSRAAADLTLDALYPEAWLLAALRDHRAAAGWLDPTLASLAATSPQLLVDPVRAACLVRAMALRAELAERLGDRTGAAQWARVVTTLWSDADSFLQPMVRRVRRLAG
jgi:hypothetical protein